MSYKSYQDICHKWWYRFDWHRGAKPVHDIPVAELKDEWPGYGRTRGGARGPVMRSWSTTIGIAVWSEKAKRNVVLFDPISVSVSTRGDVSDFSNSAHPSAVVLRIPKTGQLDEVVGFASRELYGHAIKTIVLTSVKYIDELYKDGTNRKWSRRDEREQFMRTCADLIEFTQYFACSKYVRKRKLDQIKQQKEEVRKVHEAKAARQKEINKQREKTAYTKAYESDVICRIVQQQQDRSPEELMEYIRTNLARAYTFATMGQETVVTRKLTDSAYNRANDPNRVYYYTQTIEDCLRISYTNLVRHLYVTDKLSEDDMWHALQSIGQPVFYELHNVRQLARAERTFDTFKFEGSHCITSRHISVNADAVKTLMHRWYRGKPILGAKAGAYTVVTATDTVIKVGCHRFSPEWLYNLCQMTFPDAQPGVQLKKLVDTEEETKETPAADMDIQFCEFLEAYRDKNIELYKHAFRYN